MIFLYIFMNRSYLALNIYFIKLISLLIERVIFHGVKSLRIYTLKSCFRSISNKGY